jgi:hypothetical protein
MHGGFEDTLQSRFVHEFMLRVARMLGTSLPMEMKYQYCCGTVDIVAERFARAMSVGRLFARR